MENLHSMKITCPHCRQPTQSIKRMHITWILFMVIGIGRETRIVTGCPKCMRRQILFNAGFNILTANILWPFIILPMSLYQFARTYEEGHDAEVIDEIRQKLAAAAMPPVPDDMFSGIFGGKAGKL